MIDENDPGQETVPETDLPPGKDIILRKRGRGVGLVIVKDLKIKIIVPDITIAKIILEIHPDIQSAQGEDLEIDLQGKIAESGSRLLIIGPRRICLKLQVIGGNQKARLVKVDLQKIMVALQMLRNIQERMSRSVRRSGMTPLPPPHRRLHPHRLHPHHLHLPHLRTSESPGPKIRSVIEVHLRVLIHLMIELRKRDQNTVQMGSST